MAPRSVTREQLEIEARDLPRDERARTQDIDTGIVQAVPGKDVLGAFPSSGSTSGARRRIECRSLVTLMTALPLLAACRAPAGVPVFLGYPLGAPRSDAVFRTISCPPEPDYGRLICHASDTVRLLFFADTLFQTELEVRRPDANPVTLWEQEWQTRAVQLLGPPDSLWSDADSTYSDPPRRYLVARWDAGHRSWSSVVWIFEGSVGQPDARVQWRVQCAEFPGCRRSGGAR